MKSDIKEKWLIALRSGKYTKIIGRLRDTDGFDVLGVLCDIIDPSAWKYDALTYKYLWHGESAILPVYLLEEIDYKDSYGNGYIPILDKSLTHMNDDGMSFEDIADIIEKYL